MIDAKFDTKEAAAGRLAELVGDRAFGERLLAGDKAARQEWDAAHQAVVHGPSGPAPELLPRQAAQAEIDGLIRDPAFYALFSNPRDPGHRDARERWARLNRTAARP